MLQVALEDLEHRRDGLYYHNDAPFTGVGYIRHEDGWIESEDEFREGLMEGLGRGWLAPGTLGSEAEFWRGLLHGTRREWHRNGMLASEDVFEYGVKLHGKSWDEAGKLVEYFRLTPADPAYQMLGIQREVFGTPNLDEPDEKKRR